MKYPKAKKPYSLKRNTQLKLEGLFECQPEYRKAYIDYLIREKADIKQPPLDNLKNLTRKVFEGSDTKVEERKVDFSLDDKEANK